MKKNILILILATSFSTTFGQRITGNDGDWTKQYLALKSTPEADLMIRVGDIDNLSFGFEDKFDPFSGRATDTHGYPWTLNKQDAKGTDMIMVPTSFKYGGGKTSEGYTESTKRPANIPVSIVIPLRDLKGLQVDSASLQLFIDDFQSPTYGSHFQFKVNNARFTEAEKLINRVKQDGPVGKLVTIRLTPELLSQLKKESLVIDIDDPTTGIGDGFAIDFVKLLINPRYIYTGHVKGRVVDMESQEPIANALVDVEGFGIVKTDEEGRYKLENLPAGLALVRAGAAGYASSEKQADIIEEETTEDIDFELKRASQISFENKPVQEGEDVIINSIQFGVNSASIVEDSKLVLDKIAAMLKENPSMEILLSGHTSSEGSATHNRELSLKRVRSCKDYLVFKGVDDGRISIRGFGPDQPIASNEEEEGRRQNRRVEMKITKL